MTGYVVGKGELPEQLLESGFVTADLGINLAVRALEVSVADHRRATVARARHIHHVQVVGLDDAVQVRVDEILAGHCAPVPEQHGLHIGLTT